MTNLSSRQRSACFASRRYHGRYAHASRRVTKTDDRPLLAAGAPDRAQFSNAGFRLALYLRFAAVVTTLISLGIKLVIAVMFGLLAARSSSSRTEREALQVRQQSPDAARGGLSLAALVPVENAFLRHWRNNCRSLVRRQRMRFRCKPATLPLPTASLSAILSSSLVARFRTPRGLPSGYRSDRGGMAVPARDVSSQYALQQVYTTAPAPFPVLEAAWDHTGRKHWISTKCTNPILDHLRVR